MFKFTAHRDGTVSVRMTRDEFSNLEAATVYAKTHWHRIVLDGNSNFPSIDRHILSEHTEMQEAFSAFLENMRKNGIPR